MAQIVVGTELVVCGTDPLTGFCRDGCCESTHARSLEWISLHELKAHAVTA